MLLLIISQHSDAGADRYCLIVPTWLMNEEMRLGRSYGEVLLMHVVEVMPRLDAVMTASG